MRTIMGVLGIVLAVVIGFALLLTFIFKVSVWAAVFSFKFWALVAIVTVLAVFLSNNTRFRP